MSALSDSAGFARFAAGVPRFYRGSAGVDLARLLAARSEAFLRVMQRGVYGCGHSPYRRLLDHAGVGPRELARLVEEQGVEGALTALHSEGVHVSIDEFKGRKPIRRGSLRIETTDGCFDNPLLARHYAAATGGSGGRARRLRIDLDLLARESGYTRCLLANHGLEGRPLGLWRPAPFASAGLKTAMRMTRAGHPPQRWFSQTELRGWKARLLLGVSSQAGTRFPWPEHTPLDQVMRVVRWMEEAAVAGTPAHLDTTVSGAVRVCAAASRSGAFIEGSFFRVGGEPFTAGKASVIKAAGAVAAVGYSMSEVGMISVACPDSGIDDDGHLLEDKLAAIQRPVAVGGVEVEAMFLTTLAPECPKLMLNVESGDMALLEKRECGCLFGAAGYRRHIRLIRSYEKLCTEGMCFLGTELLCLLDEILPAEFGGHPGDYQFVEEERGGVSTVLLVANPELGPLDEAAVLRRCLDVLRDVPGGEVMTQLWRDAGALRLVRRVPFVTATGKIQPLRQAGPLPGGRAD